MHRIDAHCHFWQMSRGDYGWLDAATRPVAALRRDFMPAGYPGDGRMIVVQAAPTLAETDFLLDLAAKDARIAGVVGWVDLADPDAPRAIAGRAQNPLLRGVRPMLQDIQATDWLLTGPRPDALKALGEHGLCFDALVTTRHLPVLARFAAGNADLPIIIDHAAKPQPGDRAEWTAGMQALASGPRIYCKLSGLFTELSPEELADPARALQPVVARLLEWFGPKRLVWGSDWPVVTVAATFDEWLSLTDALLGGLSAADRAAVMGGNAARFYGVAP